MVGIKNPPALAEIEQLALRVPHFPYSVKQLIRLAEHEGFSEDLIDFYRTFPAYEVFEDADDLITRTEQVEILHQEELDWRSSPWEFEED